MMRNHNFMTPARQRQPEILSFWAKVCVWNMKILLCSIEQKTQKILLNSEKFYPKRPN